MSSENSSSSRNGVALIGHCGPDSWMLKSMVKRTLPDAKIVMINSEGDLQKHLPSLRVLLVNRILDGRFESEQGVDLIRSVAAQPESPPVSLLISNFADAQQDAEAAGAKRGFGKSELNSLTASERLQSAFAHSEMESRIE